MLYNLINKGKKGDWVIQTEALDKFFIQLDTSKLFWATSS